MVSQRYAEFLPIILNWIQQKLDAHAGEKRPVASFRFPRLPHYFSKELLNSASVVITDNLPRPPLSALGLSEFVSFEKQPMGGITYFGTYVLERGAAGDESPDCPTTLDSSCSRRSLYRMRQRNYRVDRRGGWRYRLAAAQAHL